MFGNQSPLTFTRIIGGLSKTINIANQVIPLYKQAKPLISGFSESKKVIKSLAANFMSDVKKNNDNNNKREKIIDINPESIKEIELPNSPTFFK